MKADRDVEKQYTLPEFIVELRRLADALESGEGFGIEIDGEQVLVPEHAIFSIEHEREEGREEIEFQLAWESGEEEAEAESEDDAVAAEGSPATA